MRSPAELTDAFRGAGLKVTPQRERIFRALFANERHPTAESVYAEIVADMPTISLRTVYQTLHQLADLGEIVRLELGTGSARFDPNTTPHHHLVCDGCSLVVDVYPDLTELRPPELPSGFRIAGTEVVFRGRCEACGREATRSRPDGAEHHDNRHHPHPQ